MKSFSLKGINGSVMINYKDIDKSTKTLLNDICIRTKETTKNGIVSFTISDLTTLSSFIEKVIKRNKNIIYTLSPNIRFNITNVNENIYEVCIEYDELNALEKEINIASSYKFITTIKYIKELSSEIEKYIKN